MIPLKPQGARIMKDYGFYPASCLFLLCYIFLISTTISCGNTTKADKVIAFDSSIILLPKAAYLSDGDKSKIYYDCDQWYNQYLKNSNFNGGVIVAKNGNIVFERYKGNAHLKGIDTINANTSFHIASVSKTFTAMATLRLWQEGKLNIDEEVSRYLPEFNYPGVTIRCLLSHRSGLPNYIYFMEDLGWDKKVFIQNKDVLDWLINSKSEIKNIGLPCHNFTYCNTNYALLALIIESVTREPYAVYMKETFFAPLGMENTYVFTLADTNRITPSYDWRGIEAPLNYLDEVYGDKNIYSTPSDLLRWDRYLRSNVFYTPQTLEEAYKPYSNEKRGIRNYGLGWRMNIYPNGKKLIYHNGWWHGNNASFIRLQEQNTTIIVLGNRYCTGIYKTKYLANLFDLEVEAGDEDSEGTGIDIRQVRDSNERVLPKPHSRRRHHRR